ncbi:MAG TPA: DUF5752 family protein [Bacteroidales bacterium]|nr:DUF5752 family protein [Bacteroidales bacterium]
MDNQDIKIMDCALIAIATGIKAQNLRELRDHIKTIHPGCLYHHFWGNLLNPRFDDPEFQNDFAVWTSKHVHELKISERLSMVDPSIYKDIEDLRKEVLEIIEERLYESDYVPWARSGEEFHFIRSQIVVFDTGKSYGDPKDLVEVVPRMSLGSIFYHFIDARRRTKDVRNDFSVWLSAFGDKYNGLIAELDNVDPYFTTLNELRQEINYILSDYFKVAA